ncbi:hypothetical protein KIMH_03550 [Bombiscardovia apis]|uniref:Regulator of chromosome condensation, RCC1 n=1 Tax=Bombiscardovia apis TaxID=2932182 RepID=A0ABN6SDX2_9BIFI|nr:InlB B-repeat-containing protein [Bombiscardovia apis]BDR54244.1 hypothetical protein KIMH_03550 [Bombiscardovia apis]
MTDSDFTITPDSGPAEQNSEITVLPKQPQHSVITAISVDNTPVQATTRSTSSWQFTLPPHQAGESTITIDWTQDEQTQTPATFTYHYKTAYTVSFDLGDAPGTNPPSQTIPATDQNRAKFPNPTPTWDNHYFDGWFTPQNKPWNFATPVTQDLTLTAKFEPYQFSVSTDHGPAIGGNTIDIDAPKPPQNIYYSQVTAGFTHTLATGSDGNTYAWGNNASGKLGNPAIGKFSGSPVRVSKPSGVHFILYALGLSTSYAVADDGFLYVWGRCSVILPFEKECSVPTQIALPDLGDDSIYSIDSDWFTPTLLTKKGRIYRYNTITKLFEIVDLSELKTGEYPIEVSVFTFENAAALLTNTGAIYTWSWRYTLHGVLGTGVEQVDIRRRPGPILEGEAAGEIFTQIQAGSAHLLALTKQNHLYTWGSNMNGSLGFPKNDPYQTSTPMQIQESAFPADFIPKQISAQYDTSYVLDYSGRLYAWGANFYGQVGHDTAENQSYQFTPIATDLSPLPEGVTLSFVNSGSHHVVGIGTDDRLYTCGSNNNGIEDTTDPISTRQLRRVLQPQVSLVSGAFDGIPIAAPTQDPETKLWHISPPAHDPGPITAAVQWQLGADPQEDFYFEYTYDQLLPAAGSFPIKRTAGLALLAASTLAASGITLHFHRKHSVKGEHIRQTS